jgi:hypothetical protein
MKMGFNTTGNSSTSRRTAQAVNLGYLRNRIASTTRKFNYCKEHSANPSLCINQFINIAPSTLDGNLQVMVDLSGVVFTSTDYGVSFYPFQVSGNPELGLVKTSYDGTHKVAISDNDYDLYLFSNNTWTITPNQFTNIDISSDGKYQTAINQSDNTLYRSTDYGNNWAQVTSVILDQISISLSSSGQQQVIPSAPGYGAGTVYKSNNYGITWTQTNIVTTNSWISANISGDGSIITAGSVEEFTEGIIQYSLDNGTNWSTATVNWSTETPVTNRFAGNICSSYNGQYQAFISYFTLTGGPPGFIYVSTDGGVTWNKANVPELTYTFIAMSNSGKYISAVAKNNGPTLFYYFRSVNYGQTFEQINYGTVSLTGIDIN